MTNPGFEELEALIKASLQLAVWAAGEGLAPLDNNGALADFGPEEFLFRYATATGDEDYDTYPERLTARLATLRAENERLTRERDEARELAQLFSQVEHKASWIARAEAAEAEAERLRKVGGGYCLWKHVKRGSVVAELGRGWAQVAHHPIEEMTCVVIYRHVDDGSLWVRNAVEFDDGRFMPWPPPTLTASDGPREGEDGR